MRVTRCRIFFEPRDMWIGLYWNPIESGVVVYVCVVPMLPIKLWIEWGKY